MNNRNTNNFCYQNFDENPNSVNILGIDTSCDDTTIGLIDGNGKIITKKKMSLECDYYGGVVPELAARMHLENIDKLFLQVLGDKTIHAISATIGPGLLSSLVVGSNFAKTYAKIKNIPFIPVHHLEGHIYACFDGKSPSYPFLALLISGGHSDLYLCKGFGKYELIAKTCDDSAGEVFDKIGRHFGLPFPAGPHIEKSAQKASKFITPTIAMKGKLSFSFSGLKTKSIMIQEGIYNTSWFLQESIGLTLKEKVSLAIQKTGVTQVFVCGGVAANETIRKHIREIYGINVLFPPLELCMDNGAMIALAALEHIRNRTTMINDFQIDEFPRMSLEDYYG